MSPTSYQTAPPRDLKVTAAYPTHNPLGSAYDGSSRLKSGRTVADDRHSLHAPVGGKEIVGSAVLGDPVVPHHEGVLLPPNAALHVGMHDRPFEVVDDFLALFGRHSFDVGRERGVRIDPALAGLRVSADHRMTSRRILGLLLGQLLGIDARPGRRR